MNLAAQFLTALVALLHLYFLVLEMFLWTKPYGRRVFQLTPEKAELTRSLAMNQGLYNGFLAAGLVWSCLVKDPALAMPVRIFFLSCVVVAGAFGGATASPSIFAVQMLPGAIALAVAIGARKSSSASPS